MIMRFKREDLIAKLEALRPALKAKDAAALKQHKLDEADYLKRFREACRVALKWNYDEVKRAYGHLPVRQVQTRRFDGRMTTTSGAPSCPSSLVNDLDRTLAVLKASSQTRYTVQPTGSNSRAYKLLTHDAPDAQGLC